MLSITLAAFETMVAGLQAVYPLEGCGLLAGQGRAVTTTIPVTNRLQSAVAFAFEPREQVEAFLALERAGLDLVAIYHSHPRGPEQPSPRDIAQAAYPDAATVIVSLVDRRRPVARAYYIVDGEVTETPLAVQP